MIEITLPSPPTNNTYYRTVNGRTMISEKGRKYASAVAEQVLIQNASKRFEGRLSVHIDAHVPDKRKRDLDNCFKAILDSLTKAVVWLDDSQIDILSINRCGIGGFVKVVVLEL